MSVMRITALAALLSLLGAPTALHAVDGAVLPVTHFNYYGNGGGGGGGGCSDPACGCESSACSDGCCASSTCDSCCSDPCDCDSSRWSLSEWLMPCAPFTIGGWTQVGYHNNSGAITPQIGAFNNVPGKPRLHQQWFYAERVANGRNGLDFGFRADMIYGVDGTDTQAFGNPPGSWDWMNGFDHGIYSWALPQMYGEMAIDDLSVKVGHFFTIAGYEVIPAPGNFFYSHSLTMYNSEPFTHTGVLGTYAWSDTVTLYGGWTLGWDTGFDQFNSGSNYLGGFGIPLMDDVTLTYISTFGNLGARGTNGYHHSIVCDVTLTQNMNWVLASDMVDSDLAPGGFQFNNDAVSLVNYLFYDWNDWMKLGGRVEWWKGDGQSYYEATGGVNIVAHPNFVFRPEIKQIWSPANNADQTVFGMDAYLVY